MCPRALSFQPLIIWLVSSPSSCGRQLYATDSSVAFLGVNLLLAPHLWQVHPLALNAEVLPGLFLLWQSRVFVFNFPVHSSYVLLSHKCIFQYKPCMGLVTCPLVGSHMIWFLNASSCHGFLVIRMFTYCPLVSSFSPSCYLVTNCGSVHFYRTSMRVLCLALFSFTRSICSLRMTAAAGSVYSLSSGVCFALMVVGFYSFSMYECMYLFIYLIIYLYFLLP